MSRQKKGPERCYAADFEDGGREPAAKKCRSPLEGGKGTEMGSPLESPGGKKNHSSANTLILAQEDPYWISNLKNYNNFVLVKFFIWGNLLEKQWKTNALVTYNNKVGRSGNEAEGPVH